MYTFILMSHTQIIQPDLPEARNRLAAFDGMLLESAPANLDIKESTPILRRLMEILSSDPAEGMLSLVAGSILTEVRMPVPANFLGDLALCGNLA
jgi:hypothetical protein